MKLKYLLFLQVILLTSYSFSQEINIEKNEGEIYKKTVPSNKELKITIINKLLSEKYDVSISKKAIPIDEFSLPSQNSNLTSFGFAGTTRNCDILLTEANKLFNIDDEKKLSEAIKKIKKSIKLYENAIILGDEADPACLTTAIKFTNNTINQTNDIIWEDSLKPGEQLEIVITRVVAGETKKWTHIYSTEPRGEWQVSYGFSFITQAFNKEDIYYTSPSSEAMSSDYVITKEINRRSMSFAPSIFFTWMPTKCLTEGFSLGVSGGLGFDFENPTVFLSPTFSINQNIKIHLGLVAHKQNVLLGKYQENQIISEDLTSQQLHEQLYKINPFFSVSFRFDQNPFNQSK